VDGTNCSVRIQPPRTCRDTATTERGVALKPVISVLTPGGLAAGAGRAGFSRLFGTNVWCTVGQTVHSVAGRTIIGACAVLTLVSITCAADQPGIVISFSHSTPDTAYWRRHASAIQKRPFDGVVFEIDPRDETWLEEGYWDKQIDWARSRSPEYDYLAEMYQRPRELGSLSWGGGSGLTFSGATSPWNPASRYSEATLTRALEDLQAAPADHFRFNLLGIGVQAPTTDWFNEEQFEQRLQNFVVLARFARDAGLRGFLFDDEQYGSGCVWNYPVLKNRGATHGHSFDEMRATAREHGRRIGAAICCRVS